ncbi:MAG: GLPGLI family protein [Flavobacteriaceae bacterium]|nr:GLPGLI family protein [Flavobacteriaceae bacterium]
MNQKFGSKATTSKKIENSRGVHDIPITAWFAPELPFNFGPKEFNGLPGLIMELHEGDKVFTLEKIDKVLSKRQYLKKPIKGKKLKLSEFDILSKKMYQDFRKNRKG